MCALLTKITKLEDELHNDLACINFLIIKVVSVSTGPAAGQNSKPSGKRKPTPANPARQPAKKKNHISEGVPRGRTPMETHSRTRKPIRISDKRNEESKNPQGRAFISQY